MFTKAEYSLLASQFHILQTTDNYIEFQSISTKHCWIIQKKSNSNKKITIHHKHSQDIQYYHKHWQCNTVKQAIESILNHDTYILNSD